MFSILECGFIFFYDIRQSIVSLLKMYQGCLFLTPFTHTVTLASALSISITILTIYLYLDVPLWTVRYLFTSFTLTLSQGVGWGPSLMNYQFSNVHYFYYKTSVHINTLLSTRTILLTCPFSNAPINNKFFIDLNSAYLLSSIDSHRYFDLPIFN